MEPDCSLNVSGKFISDDKTMCTDPGCPYILGVWWRITANR